MKLNKTYQPADYEPSIYALWEASGAFAPSGVGESYSIVMPPPNANANLHVGHSLEIIKDIMIRYQRMRGRDAIYIPGADHAGFETWVVFERNLEKQGKSRFDYSRDMLYQMTWDFVDQNRKNMEMQIRALGVSCDWNHNFFTLDRGAIDVVYTTFKKMWDDGLIYRGERIVNYCTKHDTSFADIEVDYREGKGKLWYIKYPIVAIPACHSGLDPESRQNSMDSPIKSANDGGVVSDDEYITVATTRPETMLGDEAVAVNPGDKRYKKLIGQKVVLPMVGKEIPIIADEAVEYEFGTGAVKVTPAHDPIDFDIAQRHNLPITSVIGYDGLMISPVPAEFVGLTAEQAREQVVEQLEHQGLISKIEDYKHQVPYCYKCGTVIQPLVKDQWFVKVKPLAEKAKKAIKDGKIKFTPKSKGEELIRYYDELKDWNISRQIPWGIPIPAFRRENESRVKSQESRENTEAQNRASCLMPHASDSEWIFNTQVSEKEIEIDGVKYVRDEDTFDTWFSSGQWPYIVTRGDLTRFYPTTLMEHGVDILRPWNARMIMLGLYITGKVPYENVYLHGMVTDERGQKMSKSKGNVVNPMDFVEKYGSDALRMGIIANRSAGQPQAFSTATVVAGRNFCNKLWNIARFVSSNQNHSAEHAVEFRDEVSSSRISESPTRRPAFENSNQEATSGNSKRIQRNGFDSSASIADHWVLRQLDQAREQIEKLLGEYRFSEAFETLYHVVWDDVADWYVESAKLTTDNRLLTTVLELVLKLAHPFAPFVTETIWQSLYNDDKDTIPHHFLQHYEKHNKQQCKKCKTVIKSGVGLISQQWPEKLRFDKKKAAEFERVKGLVSEIRARNVDLGGGKRKLYYVNSQLVAKNTDLIKFLGRLESVDMGRGSGLRLRVSTVCHPELVSGSNNKIVAVGDSSSDWIPEQVRNDKNTARDDSAQTGIWLSANAKEIADYQAKLETNLAETKKEVKKLEARLANKSYVKNAPAELVAETQNELATKKSLIEQLRSELLDNS